MNSVPINGATLSGWRVLPKPKQKRNGRTNILLLLAYQRFWVFFSKDTDTNKAVRQLQDEKFYLTITGGGLVQSSFYNYWEQAECKIG